MHPYIYSARLTNYIKHHWFLWPNIIDVKPDAVWELLRWGVIWIMLNLNKLLNDFRSLVVPFKIKTNSVMCVQTSDCSVNLFSSLISCFFDINRSCSDVFCSFCLSHLVCLFPDSTCTSARCLIKRPIDVLQMSKHSKKYVFQRVSPRSKALLVHFNLRIETIHSSSIKALFCKWKKIAKQLRLFPVA